MISMLYVAFAFNLHAALTKVLTLLLLKGCPQQVDGWFLGQMDGTRLLVDMSHTLSAVSL